MDSAQLAEFAKHGKVHEYVIETITEGGIDGDMAYDLKDNELVAFADNEVKHQVLLKSARKKMMKKTTTSSTRGKNKNTNTSAATNVVKYGKKISLHLGVGKGYTNWNKLPNAESDAVALQKRFQLLDFDAKVVLVQVLQNKLLKLKLIIWVKNVVKMIWL